MTTRKKRKTKRTPEELRRTAFHEAGHAIISRVLGLLCGGVSIVPNFDEMGAGFAITDDPWAIFSAWQERGKFRGEHYVSVMRGRIMAFMAGAEAEVIAFGSHSGDTDDRRQIVALMAEDANISGHYLERLRPKVRGLLRRHWRKVEGVAKALLASNTLAAGEVDALIEAVKSPGDRAIAKRIEAARKPDRDRYLALARS